MKIVVACDSFKGSCTAKEAAGSISAGICRVYPKARILQLPVSDGGEGMLDAILQGAGGRRKYVDVKNPQGQNIKASFAIMEDRRAVIEMAEASGLTLISQKERNPLTATTYGTGQLIRAALDEGCPEIIVGIGGSGTNDGGTGMAQALGARFLDGEGKELPWGGGALGRLKRIELSGLDKRLAGTKVIIASDVANPLCGKEGASRMYGPQKGATPEMVEQLEAGLAHMAETAKEQLGEDIRHMPGAGAAGGLGAGLMLFCRAERKPGIDMVLDLIRFDEKIQDADMVITGEGRLDTQSLYGKVPVGIAGRVKSRRNIPVFALAGGIGEGVEGLYEKGIDACLGITREPVSLEYAMENVETLLEEAAGQLMRIIKTVQDCGKGQHLV